MAAECLIGDDASLEWVRLGIRGVRMAFVIFVMVVALATRQEEASCCE